MQCMDKILQKTEKTDQENYHKNKWFLGKQISNSQHKIEEKDAIIVS